MTSTRPYLIRALYDWILDNQCTPYLLVNSTLPGVEVPQEHAKDGRIILNLSPGAVRDLLMDNSRVEFSARFSGVARLISVPVGAVLAIYARENGQGMFFEEEPTPSDDNPPDEGAAKPRVKPSLKVVK